MTLELVLFVAIVAFVSSVISLWAFGKALRSHKQIILELYNRVQYIEVGMSYHGLTPLPWEMEDIEDHFDDIKDFKREGNVVFLNKEQENTNE